MGLVPMSPNTSPIAFMLSNIENEVCFSAIESKPNRLANGFFDPSKFFGYNNYGSS